MADKVEKQPKNIVHEQAILVETIKKEMREGKLYENFSINPFTKRNIFGLFYNLLFPFIFFLSLQNKKKVK